MHLGQIYENYNDSSNLSDIDGEWQWVISTTFSPL